MPQERFFSLLSIALLGAGALAAIPEGKTGPEISAETVIEMGAGPVPSQDVELQAAREVDAINNGKFRPYVSGDVAPTFDSGSGGDSEQITN